MYVCVPARFKRFRRTAAPSAWRADAEQTRVVKVGDFHLDSGRDGGGVAVALRHQRTPPPPIPQPAPGEPLGTMGDKLTLIAAG